MKTSKETKKYNVQSLLVDRYNVNSDFSENDEKDWDILGQGIGTDSDVDAKDVDQWVFIKDENDKDVASRVFKLYQEDEKENEKEQKELEEFLTKYLGPKKELS